LGIQNPRMNDKKKSVTKDIVWIFDFVALDSDDFTEGLQGNFADSSRGAAGPKWLIGCSLAPTTKSKD